MWLLLWATLSVAHPVQQSPAQPPAVPPAVPAVANLSAPSAKIWIGHYEEFEEFIRSAKIERTKEVGVGVTAPVHAYFAPGGLAGGVVAKNLPPGRRDGFWESYLSEIAAYKLDRLLGLDMVPPTVERSVNGNTVSVQLWVNNVRSIKELKNATPPPGVGIKWLSQVNRQKVFDDLINNIDDNAGNILLDENWTVVLVDHSRCFTPGDKLVFPLSRIDRPLFERLKALDKEEVKRTIGPLLPPGGLDSLMRRRDLIVATFEKLVKEKGEIAVFWGQPGS